jgi:hypothetical protein
VKLDFEQRQEAVKLEERVVGDPGWASEEIVGLRAHLKIAVEYMNREQIHEIPDYSDKCASDCDECARRRILREIEGSE